MSQLLNDIALRWLSSAGAADFAIENNDLATDGGLETSVILSLFTNRRAGPNEILPAGVTDRQGWWADALSLFDGDLFGSRLWLLAREKDTGRVRQLTELYAREALAWMIEDGVTDRIDVVVSVPQKGVLLLEISIYRPNVDPASFRYNYNWQEQAARRAA